MREAAFAEARARYGDRVVDRALRLRRSVGLEPRGDVRLQCLLVVFPALRNCRAPNLSL